MQFAFHFGCRQMTLAQRLAREAALCSADHNGNGFIGLDCECHLRPAVQASIEEAIRACQRRARWWHDNVEAAQAKDLASVDEAILSMLTDDVEDGA